MVLATFGLIACTALAIVTGIAGRWVATIVLAVLASVAIVDLVVISLRRRARRQTEDGGHSLFE
jgi:hypothetical protein